MVERTIYRSEYALWDDVPQHERVTFADIEARYPAKLGHLSYQRELMERRVKPRCWGAVMPSTFFGKYMPCGTKAVNGQRFCKKHGGVTPTPQPIDVTGVGRLFLNGYGRACWEAGYQAGRDAGKPACGAKDPRAPFLCVLPVGHSGQHSSDRDPAENDPDPDYWF